MEIQPTSLSNCYILHPEKFSDERGHFFESFNRAKFEKLTGENGNFVQDNQSFSKYGTIRGIHFQKGDFAQAKLVRAIQGRILDVAVDLRLNSSTYGQHFAIELSDINNSQLYVPSGFGHGFSVLSEVAIFAYKCDNYYFRESESGVKYDDPMLKIDWKIPFSDMIISKKDLALDNLNKY